MSASPTTTAAPRMRVLHVINAMNLGGAEMVALEHIRQAGAGVESTVCAVNNGGWAMQEAERLGAKSLVLGKQGGRLGAMRRLVDALRRERIDVVNGHNPSGGFYAAVAGRFAGTRVIVRTEHSIRHPGRFSGIYDAAVEPLLTVLTDRVICVCDAVRRSQLERMGWAANKCVTVLNGIASAPAAPELRDATRAALGLEPEHVAAITVASLTPAKAQHVLVDAFAEVVRAIPEARLLFVGEGPLRGALEQQVRGLGFEDRVQFLGMRKDIPALLAAADVYVLSSSREGLSMSVLEAMRAAKPCIVTDVGGNAEAVTHDGTGLVVSPGDPQAFARALIALLPDRVRQAAWGAAARTRWEASFTAEHMVKTTENLYRRLLDRPETG